MRKLNQKGFTLIEMLVVIAVIAILVAIAIPTIGSATDKAAAATNAANLRSFQAELTTALLTGDLKIPEGQTTVAKSLYPKGVTAPKPKAVGPVKKTATLFATYDKAQNSIKVDFDGYTIESFAQVASGAVQAKDMQKNQ